MDDPMILLIGAGAGFFIIPPLANSFPVVINSFLLLVLLSALLLNNQRWLPYLDRLAKAA